MNRADLLLPRPLHLQLPIWLTPSLGESPYFSIPLSIHSRKKLIFFLFRSPHTTEGSSFSFVSSLSFLRLLPYLVSLRSSLPSLGSSQFGMFSLFIKEKAFIGEAVIATCSSSFSLPRQINSLRSLFVSPLPDASSRGFFRLLLFFW